MGRKKKEIIEDVFIPSKYQEAIFDFVKNGSGNAVIEAVAGSGKTLSAMKCLGLIEPDKKVLFISFGKDIVEELTKRVKKITNNKNIKCQTFHSLGNMIVRECYNGVIDPEPNIFKYKSYIYNNIVELSDKFFFRLKKEDRDKYVNNILKYIDYGRYYLCETEKDLDFVEEHYDILTYRDEKEIALMAMEWGKENLDTIDYNDMIWLPNVLECCKDYKLDYDWIICDECQDTMKTEREMLLRFAKKDVRMLFFGEKVQCIYSFMGSDYRSFDELRKIPNTISLPLSISYRCSKNVVKLAKRFNPHIEARDGAPDGNVSYNVGIDQINDGDMVLCRLNAPLLQLFSELTKIGKQSYIRGRDIGSNLITLIKKTKEEYLNRNLESEGVFSKLYSDFLYDVEIIMKKHNITLEMAMEDMTISSEYDKIKSLEIISNGINTSEELIDKIRSIFSDRKKKGVELSTIHKAKGLESDNVFICCPSLLPLKSAKKEWEIEEELNLEYVAYTRAKINLSFLDEKMFESNNSSNSAVKLDVDDIRKKLLSIGCSTPKTSAEIIANSKPIEKERGKTIDLGKINNKARVSGFQPQKTKKRRLF